MIANWKRQAAGNMAEAFTGKAGRARGSDERQIKELHAKIGQLMVERDFSCIDAFAPDWVFHGELFYNFRGMYAWKHRCHFT